jgi:hypothetical protein
MYRQLIRACCAGTVALVTACGEAPQPVQASPEPVQQHMIFTAFAEPAAGRFQIIQGPRPALSKITQDKNGDPATAAGATVQIFSSNVAFASGGVGYLSGCNTQSPQIMYADVDLLTGFNEMLRNTYVRITSVSGGQTFCGTSAAVGAFGGSLSPSVFLYNYTTLDKGSDALSRLHRSLKWGLQLPDNTAFWFDGELWAEIIPAAPTIAKPADGTATNQGNSTAEVVFLWTLDGTANGGTATAPLPRNVGAQLTILRCNAISTGAYNPAACTTTFLPATLMTQAEYAAKVPVGYWYQWSLRSAFTLPGQPNITTIGSFVTTRSFKAN